ncbi:hypothetical protein [Parabacteroides merdae]|uniref:hypothetical protein n=1 Tax=Parabacteroides merdae TaxID=46503 RepID=UPI0034A1ABD2
MKEAAKFFSITFGNIERTMQKAKEIHDSVKKGTPFASVRLKMLWDYYDNPKKETDIAYFCAFCAIKSILGDKGYIKTNKSLIIARMFGLVDIKSEKAQEKIFSASAAHRYINSRGGCIGVNQITGAVRSGELMAGKNSSGYELKEADLIKWAVKYADMPEPDNSAEQLMQKYSMRYHIDNVLLELQTNWGLKLYSDHSRGFYLSFTKSLEELAVISLESKSKSKVKSLSQERAKAKESALRKLGLK